ncbi:MAG: hypothetical protein PUP92_23085 [Rhizonema sp. PD38]|nr:hypothetical protein [Rhizonema sp. PD38]
MLQQYTKFVTIDEQTIAQAELNAYISQQAQEIAPEPEVQFIDLDGFYNYKALANGKTIAIITHDSDDFVTQPWVVMVGEVEVHRANTWVKCAHYIQWHYLRGTLPSSCVAARRSRFIGNINDDSVTSSYSYP